ncbi:hypothetical protein P3612_11215 [Vibrio parahaemolyticus]|uniref:hypothetical protein n=1 Tax=unclassified Vibrio TaxID=2614977 RepID=UPI002A025D7D|nr:hypothetical protein [Vibrio parahaemolyticus]
MGGSSNKVEETAAEKAASKVAVEQWNLYDSELKQYEDVFMQRVDNFNSESNMADAKASVDLNYNKNFGEARSQSATNMAAQGIDPSSGKFKGALSDITLDQSLTQGDAINRAQVNEQDNYVVGQQDVVAIGMGQKAEGLAGMDSTASLSASKSANDAVSSFNRRSANAQFVGSLAGMGVASMSTPNTNTLSTYEQMQAGSSNGYAPMGGASSYGME